MEIGFDLQQVTIGSVKGRRILDSRGNPTIEIELTARDDSGATIGHGRATAPSGASRGIHEVVAFPEGGVDASLRKVEKLAGELVGKELDQAFVDKFCRDFDGTSDLREVGGNAVVALSMAAAKAAASARGLPLYEYLRGDGPARLPFPLGNILGGGLHAGERAPDIQEFLSLPIGARSFEEAAFGNARVHKRVKEILGEVDRTFTGGKDDEGAWAPNLGNRDSLEIVAKACKEVSDELGFEIGPGLDVAASSFFDSDEERYEYRREGELRSAEEQIELILDFIDTYDLVYVEDPVWEEDFESFAEITSEAGDGCLICGDDLFVTNVRRIRRGMEVDAANSVLIKPNQVGTLTNTKEAIELSKEEGTVPVMSHRSGETPDDTIAHLAVGFGCPIIKTGVVGGESIAKLNELIRIEEELGRRAEMGTVLHLSSPNFKEG